MGPTESLEQQEGEPLSATCKKNTERPTGRFSISIIGQCKPLAALRTCTPHLKKHWHTWKTRILIATSSMLMCVWLWTSLQRLSNTRPVAKTK